MFTFIWRSKRTTTFLTWHTIAVSQEFIPSGYSRSTAIFQCWYRFLDLSEPPNVSRVLPPTDGVVPCSRLSPQKTQQKNTACFSLDDDQVSPTLRNISPSSPPVGNTSKFKFRFLTDSMVKRQDYTWSKPRNPGNSRQAPSIEHELSTEKH